MAVWQNFGMFIMGIRDSISLEWCWLLFYADPANKMIHPSSKKMFTILQNTFIQILLFLIGIPSLFLFIGYPFISMIFDILILLLTYGYLFFYNEDIMVATKEIVLWKQKRYSGSFPQIDSKQRIQIFTALSGNVKSFVFLLLYYLPIYFITSLLLSRVPVLGPLCLIVSESFFNSAFYFLKKWPYDRYNIGFMEKNLFYMLGYGLFVSLVCNFILKGSLARAAYFLISMWMIINCVIYSPPQVTFSSMKEIIQKVRNQSNGRKILKNGYNQHRKKIRVDKSYRKSIVQAITLVKPALKITEFLNQKLSSLLLQSQSQKRQTSSTFSSSSSNNSKITQIILEENDQQ